VFWHQALMAFPQSQRLRGLEEPFGTVGEFFEIHDASVIAAFRRRYYDEDCVSFLIYGNLCAQEKDLRYS
jgi:hypothetical protein